METGFYSIDDIKAMIFTEHGRFFFIGQDSDGHFVEIEFVVVSKSRNGWVVNVKRFYTSYNDKISEIHDKDYNFLIPKEDFGSIRRKSKFL
jgi:hypothetical protein